MFRSFSLLPVLKSFRDDKLTFFIFVSQLTYGADFRAQNDESETPIHIAAKEGRNEILRHFLQRGETGARLQKRLLR